MEWIIRLKSRFFRQGFESKIFGRMSEDINRLVTATSQQPKPFIFVGADLGALISRFYTQMYEL